MVGVELVGLEVKSAEGGRYGQGLAVRQVDDGWSHCTVGWLEGSCATASTVGLY